MDRLILPEWYGKPLANSHSGPLCRRGLDRPVRKALARLAEAIAQELSTGGSVSWVGAVEPRAKTFGILLLTVTATLLHRFDALGGLLLASVIVAVSCRLPARRLVRVWLGAPLFSLAIILPATLNIVTPGASLVTLWHFGPGVTVAGWRFPEALAVTEPGLVVAARFLLRTSTCVSLMFLLVATTPAAALSDALRRLGLPRVFGMVLTMCQRYLVVMLRAAEEIHLAKLSRSIGSVSLRREQSWVAAGAGILFRKSWRMAGQVHAAMVSRGYDGDLHVPRAPALRLRDGVWLVVCVVVAAGLLCVDRML